MSNDKFYAGTVYIGVVGGEMENGLCRDSIHAIQRRPGDTIPLFIRGTKGYETRQLHFNKFINETEHDFLFLLDHDMIFQPDTLERLRNRGRAYISGSYMRRTYNPIAPVWFRDNPELQWPFEPDTEILARGQLHEKGATGWGCVLIHREVVTAVRQLLKGEFEVLEDDMDIWPYDLERVLKTIRALQTVAKDFEWFLEHQEIDNLKNLIKSISAVLSEEIRPLRAAKDIIGSDIRFPFFAHVAGYKLWIDPDVRPGHMLNYPLSPDDFEGLPEQARQSFAAAVGQDVAAEREKLVEQLKQLEGR